MVSSSNTISVAHPCRHSSCAQPGWWGLGRAYMLCLFRHVSRTAAGGIIKTASGAAQLLASAGAHLVLEGVRYELGYEQVWATQL